MANDYVYGCVDWGTGVITFDNNTNCELCEEYTGCISEEGDAHDGQIAVTPTSCDCADTYYACVYSWADIVPPYVGYNFKVTMPADCIGFTGLLGDDAVYFTPSGLVDCENCVPGSGGAYYKFYDVDTYVNGTQRFAVYGGTAGGCCYWIGTYDPAKAITVRRWSTSDCTGSYTDYDASSVKYLLYKSDAILEIAIAVEGPVWDKYPVFYNNDEAECCFYQNVSNELACGDSLPDLCADNLVTEIAVCENGEVDLDQKT